jgi:tRNA nucleotidyltransferase (CCA-adding enzyme)
MNEKASLLPPGGRGLVALDWFNGNRSILVDSQLSGMLLGLTLRTKPEEIYRALMEASAYTMRTIVENYENQGLPIAERFVRRITGEKAVIRYVLNMVPLHMRPNMHAWSKPGIKSTNRMFDAAICPEDLIWFSMADRPLLAGSEEFTGDSKFLFGRLEQYREIMSKPHVTGEDLIRAGLKPDERFSGILAYAHKLRLAGIDKESALKQTLAYARKLKK